MIALMLTVEEVRRLRLMQLASKHGSLANLNEAVGYARTSAVLSRIINMNERKGRPGEIFQMGSPMARKIEKKLNLERAWMDSDPTALQGLREDDPRATLMKVAEKLAPYHLQALVRLAGDLAAEQPQSDVAAGGKR